MFVGVSRESWEVSWGKGELGIRGNYVWYLVIVNMGLGGVQRDVVLKSSYDGLVDPSRQHGFPFALSKQAINKGFLVKILEFYVNVFVN